MEAPREIRAASFNQIPELYDAMRPGYPEALYDDLISLCLTGPARVLEIGCGPATFTLPLARRGLHVTALEPGPDLARYAAGKLAPWPNARVVTSSFEAFQEPGSFDLLVAANSFHWLDPDNRWQRCAGLLTPTGHLALVWNRPVRTGAFQQAAEALYESLAPAMVRRRQDSGQWITSATEETPLFASQVQRAYPFTTTLTGEDYVRLLNTYSDHLTLPDDQRRALFDALVDLAQRDFGGVVEQPYESLLDLRVRVQGT